MKETHDRKGICSAGKEKVIYDLQLSSLPYLLSKKHFISTY